MMRTLRTRDPNFSAAIMKCCATLHNFALLHDDNHYFFPADDALDLMDEEILPQCIEAFPEPDNPLMNNRLEFLNEIFKQLNNLN